MQAPDFMTQIERCAQQKVIKNNVGVLRMKCCTVSTLQCGWCAEFGGGVKNSETFPIRGKTIHEKVFILFTR